MIGSGDAGRAFLDGLREQQPKIAEAVRQARQNMIGAVLKPSVGRVVHYVSHGTPVNPDGSQAFGSECRAAIVTEVTDDHTVGLCVLNPTGQFFNRGVVFDSGEGAPGDPECLSRANHGNPFRYCACGWTEPAFTGGWWHWPERTEP